MYLKAIMVKISMIYIHPTSLPADYIIAVRFQQIQFWSRLLNKKVCLMIYMLTSADIVLMWTLSHSLQWSVHLLIGSYWIESTLISCMILLLYYFIIVYVQSLKFLKTHLTSLHSIGLVLDSSWFDGSQKQKIVCFKYMLFTTNLFVANLLKHSKSCQLTSWLVRFQLVQYGRSQRGRQP